MHELAITQSWSTSSPSARPAGRVVAVNVRVGDASGIVPDAMAFCFDVATAGRRSRAPARHRGDAGRRLRTCGDGGRWTTCPAVR